jgi:uncharacterized protein YgbK (DUF1537 family)
MPRILVIADDFTGAAEIGGIAHLFGLSVNLQTSPSDAGEQKDDVVVLDTNSRSLKPHEAFNLIKTQLAHLNLSGFDFIYKKVDSVLRGPIVHEINAILSTTDLNQTVLVSANPSKGRIIKNGIYYINGIPIDQTEFQHDPEYPSKSPYVKDLIHNTVDRTVSDPSYEEDNYDNLEIPDAYSADNLMEIVCSRLTEKSLAAGGADFFTAILDHKLKLKQTIKATYTPGGGNRHFIIGTRSINGVRTIDTLLKQGYSCFYLPANSPGAGVVYEEFIEEIDEAIEEGHPLIIARPEHELKGVPILQRITELLSGSAFNLIKQCNSGDEIFIEGGETASAIIRNLNTDLRIREVPGIGTVKLELDNSGIFLIVKPGSYSWPNKIFDYIQKEGKI